MEEDPDQEGLLDNKQQFPRLLRSQGLNCSSSRQEELRKSNTCVKDTPKVVCTDSGRGTVSQRVQGNLFGKYGMHHL